MNVQHFGRAALVCALALAGPAQAQAPVPAAPAKPAPASGMSESKFMGLLYAEIEKHTPEENPAGPGEVTASFVIGPSGRVAKVTIDKTTSPAHAELVKKILSDVVTPPPPAGATDYGQTFRFR